MKSGDGMRVFAMALAFVSAVGSAEAADYCQFSGGALSDGGTLTIHVKVMVSSLAPPPPNGSTDPAARGWCTQNWHSLGSDDGSHIVVFPKRGKLVLQGYTVFYRGDKIGRDHFAIERKWLGPSNEHLKGTQNYDVEIVGAPF